MSRRETTIAETDARTELEILLDETVLLYHRLSTIAAKIHRLEPLSGPRRTVLVTLARSGPQTVAQMARARAQSRQRFQPLVNGLLADGLVETRANPGHRQSPFIALTSRGEKTVRHIVTRERELSSRFSLAIAPRTILRAATVLREVRQGLEVQLPGLLAERAARRRTRTVRR